MEEKGKTENRDIVIEVSGVKKRFKSYQDKASSLKERFVNPSRGRHEDIMVLKGISFQVRRGEAVGMIGKNGCGKSTTLKLLTRILRPNEGQIKINGRVSSLIELGAGFHPDMTGRENIYTNASIFGITRKEVEKRMDEIIRFSELEEFIDNPVRTYSSGMYMRLAFAVAINVDADVLLIDEILAVGDSAFQRKCFEKLKSIKENGTTIVIVSHSMEQMYKICDRLIWIEDGLIREDGVPRFVGEEYLAAMEGKRLKRKELEAEQEAAEKEAQERETKEKGKETQDREKQGSENNKAEKQGSEEQEKEEPSKEAAASLDEGEQKMRSERELPAFCWKGAHQIGDGRVRLTDAYILDAAGERTSSIGIRQKFGVVYHYQSELIGERLNFVISFTREDGIYCFGTGSVSGGHKKDAYLAEKSGTVKVFFETNNLQEGVYRIDLGIQGFGGAVFDYIYSALELKIEGDREKAQAGIVNMSRKWESQGRVVDQEY